VTAEGATPVELTPFATPQAALARQAAERGEAPALIFPEGGARLDFAGWQAESEALARGLLRRGLKPGDHVALLAENRVEWPVAQLAVAMMGGVLVPLNTHYRAEELRYALDQSDSRALLLSPRFRAHDYLGMAAALVPELPKLGLVLPFGEGEGGFAGHRAVIAEGAAHTGALPRVESTAPAALLYTSGTTGRPKGALLTHRAMLGNAWQTAQRLGFRAGDRYTSIIPLFHCAGCILGLLGSLQTGATYVGVPAFDPEALFRVIEAERCTLMSGVPTSYLAMLRHPARTRYDLSSLRAGTCGGADANPEVLAECARAFPMPGLSQVYGQTEAATLISCPRYDDPERFVTAGPPLPGHEVRITDPATGAVLPPGQIGQIEARGAMVMLGYYNKPEETAETIDEKGWLHSGDLGFLTPEGRVVIAGGRLRDMIIRGGENIYPVEIEQVLAGHPAVAEAAVFGLPDEYYGEIVAAAIRFKGEPPAAAAITAYCGERLAKFKAPARVFAIERFPLTASGKIRKTELKEMVRSGALEPLP
jgi:fatty-acyl-CoA synthase